MDQEKDKNQPEIVEQINDFPAKKQEDRFEHEKESAEDDFQKGQRKLALRKKLLNIVVMFFVLVLIVAAASVTYLRSRNEKTSANINRQVAVEVPKNQDHVFVSDGKVSAGIDESDGSEKKSPEGDTKGIAGTSESYRIRDIAIGGGNIVLAAETESLPLKIKDVRSENLMSRDGKKMQTLLSWKTNKLAKSQVKYTRGEGGVEKNIKEYGYGFSHALVLNNLEPSQGCKFFRLTEILI